MKTFKDEKKKNVTICLHETIIEKGKEIARNENRSLSGLIENLISREYVKNHPPIIMKDFIANPDIKNCFR